MPRGSASGAPAIFRSRRAPISSRPWKRAASPRWKCWPAISRRSASTPRARCPSRASNTRSSSIALTAEQIRIYDAYADAFQIIHRNLNEALKAANITGADGSTYNRNAKAAARSAFESNKQRFFNHLLTAMKCPTLIAAIARDLEDGHAVVLQIVSTNEALARPPPGARSRPRNGAISRSTSRRANMCSTI